MVTAQEFPEVKDRLAPNADIFHDPVFESVLVKIQQGDVDDPTLAQRSSVEALRVPSEPATISTPTSRLSQTERAEKMRKEQKYFGDEYIDTPSVFS